MKMTLIPFGESDYNELLLQAVAVLPWGHNLILPVKIYLPILFKYVLT